MKKKKKKTIKLETRKKSRSQQKSKLININTQLPKSVLKDSYFEN